MSSKRWRSYGWLLVNAVCWGLAFVVVKPSFEVTTPLRFLWYRYVLAVFFSLPILAYYWPQVKDWRQLLVRVSVLEFFGTFTALTLLYTGLKYTTTVEASLLTTTLPLFVTLGGIWLLKEKQEKREWEGLVLALGGAAWLTLGAQPLNWWQQSWSLLGNFLIIGHNTLNMFYFPLTKKLYKPYPKFLVTTLSFYVGAIMFGLASWWEQPSLTVLSQTIASDLHQPVVWIAAGYMALFGSIIGLTAYIRGQDGVEASEASLFWYLQTAVALPASIFLLKETVASWQWLALGVLLLGVGWAEYRPRRRATSRATSPSRS